MSTETNPKDIVSEYYEGYKETQADILKDQSLKVRNCIFALAILIFVNDMLGLYKADLISTETVIYSLVVPLILVGVGFLAIKHALLAIIIAALIVAGLITYSIVLYGGVGAISGLITKAIMAYFVLAGFQSAREAEQARKELKN